MTDNLKWQTDLPGFGNSSPIVWHDRVFLTSATRDGRERCVLCIDRDSGKMLWQQTAAKDPAPDQIHEWNTYASASCATDGERVYAFFGTPGLFCYDYEGKLVWKRDFGKLGCSTGWGVGASSPILFEDLVIVNGDHGAEGSQVDTQGVNYGPSWLWAMNKYTGEVVWKTPRNQGMSWGTPLILNVQGRTELVLNSPHGVYGYDPHTGRELWRVGGRGPRELFGEITPAWGNGLLFAFTGRGGTPAYAVRLGGNGDVTATHIVWTTRRGNRDVSSPIVVGDYLYGVDRDGLMICYDARTGKIAWQQRLGGKVCASFVYVRGKLVIVNDEGAALVFDPGPQFKPVHTNRLGDGDAFRASPAIVDGQMLIRSDRRLYCVAAQ
jgi:outer membrane protein assembly factor BamB